MTIGTVFGRPCLQALLEILEQERLVLVQHDRRGGVHRLDVDDSFSDARGADAGGLAVISDVPKTLVYDIARFLNRETATIPESIITSAAARM